MNLFFGHITDTRRSEVLEWTNCSFVEKKKMILLIQTFINLVLKINNTNNNETLKFENTFRCRD